MSDMEPTEISVVGRRPVPEKLMPDGSDGSAVAGAKAEREGLPPSYRMRADAHYVDQLTARRGDRFERAGHGSPSSEPAPDAGDAELRGRRVDRVLAQVADDVATITAAADLLPGDGASLAGRLGVDLIRAQAWRATWLIRAHTLIEDAHRGSMRSRPLGPVIDRVRQGMTPECRLAGVVLQVHATDWSCPVLIDEAAFITGVAGAVFATLGLMGSVEAATIRIAAEVVGGDLRTVEVSQDEVAAGAQVPPGFFEPSWEDPPGGLTAGLGAAAARAAAQVHGGLATLLLGDRRGTAIRLALGRPH